MDSAPVHRYGFGDFQIDVSRRRLLRAGAPVPLTPKAFATLLYLVEHPGTVLGREELLAAMWPDVVVEENNLGQAISKLRNILGETPGENRYIITIPGRGYRFAADVTELTDRDGPGDVHAGFESRAGEPGAPRTLAVLPFQPLVPGGGNAALEFGMADSLIMKLGHIRELTVLPLAAVRRFHGDDAAPHTARQELGVDAVLDGHIHHGVDRVRVTARLVRVDDGRQLWAGQYDEQATGIFDIQDAISERVTRELELRLTSSEEQRLARRDTGNAAAYEAYLNGRLFLSLAQPRNAIEMFGRAVQLDPGFASAHAGLADTLSRLPVATDGPSAEPIGKARALALAALRIDPDLAQAHAVLGWVAFYYDWDWRASEEHYRRALTLDSRDFSAHLGYAHLLSNTFRADEAIQQVDLALAIDRLSPLAGTLRSQFLFYAGRHDEAAAQLERTLDANPGFWIGHAMLGKMHLHANRYDEAAAAFATAGAGGGAWTPRAYAAYTLGVSGNRRVASQQLQEMVGTPGAAPPPYLIALANVGLGESDDALMWLERAYDERDVRMVFLGVDPVWEPLHDDERFAKLLRRMNFGQPPRS